VVFHEQAAIVASVLFANACATVSAPCDGSGGPGPPQLTEGACREGPAPARTDPARALVPQREASCTFFDVDKGQRPVLCRYRCAGLGSAAKALLPVGMTRCPGEDGAALHWGQIQDVLAPVSAAARVPDDTRCRPRGSGGGGTFKSPTWCAYDCEGMQHPVEIELPPGMTSCPGNAFDSVTWGDLRRFHPATRIRTPREPAP